MRKSFVVFSAFLALCIASCASSAPSRPVTPAPATAPSDTPSAPAASPVPPAPHLQVVDVSAWVEDTTTDTSHTYVMVFRHSQAVGMCFLSVDSPGMLPEQKAAFLIRAVESGGDESASPLEMGTHDGIAFAGFKTVETTEHGLMAGAVIVRRVKGSPYLVTIIGKWPIEAAPLMLADFQTLVSALYIDGQTPPIPDLEDWFRPRGGELPSLE